MLSSAVVSAQTTQFVPKDTLEQLEAERQGFDGALSVGANVNLTSNRNVIGQVEGFSTLFGLSAKGGLDYRHVRHVLRNTLSINESWARTPVVDEFVKNADNVSIESLYNYYMLTWLGAFGRVQAETALFVTDAVTAEEANYVINQADGTQRAQTTNRLRLAEAFEPLTLAESIGMFVEPYQTPPLSASIRLGLGARQSFVDGVLLIQNDAATPQIEVNELSNAFQAGLEGFAGVRGRLADNRLRYEVGAAVLIPFLNNDAQERDALALTRLALIGQVSSSVFSWASVSYQLSVISDPQLISEVQVQNALLLTFIFDIVERDPGTPAPTPEELLREAQLKLADAEQLCAEAMTQAQQAQQRALDAEVEAREAREQAAQEEALRRAAEEEIRRQRIESETAPQ